MWVFWSKTSESYYLTHLCFYVGVSYHNSVSMSLSHLGKDDAQYVQGPGFEPRTLHLFIFKWISLATKLLDKKKRSYHNPLKFIYYCFSSLVNSSFKSQVNIDGKKKRKMLISVLKTLDKKTKKEMLSWKWCIHWTFKM